MSISPTVVPEKNELADTLDLEAYFHRIGYTGEPAPTLDTLRTIHQKHAETIAFENLNPLVGWPVELTIGALQRKLVRSGRGGYCFEHNLLLSHVLQAIGFGVTGLAARLLWNRPEGTITARGHMLLLVDVAGAPFIADVGFGGLTLTAPLRLEADIVQATPHEPFRLIRVGEEFILQANIRDVWKPMYRFGLQEQLLPDYEVTSWYLSHHPDSHFVYGLTAARPAPEGRYALRNNELTVHYQNGRTERKTLTSAAELRETLEGVFKLTLPESPELNAALQRQVAPDSPDH